MQNFVFEFPGRNVEVTGAPDQATAMQAAIEEYKKQNPEDFAAWDATRPMPGFVHAARGTLGSIVGGVATGARAAGAPGQETLTAAQRAIEGEQDPRIRQFEGLSDFAAQVRRRPVEAIRSGVGQVAGSIAGMAAVPLAAAGAASMAGASPAIAGGLVLGASIGAGALSSANELEQLLIREGVDPKVAARLGISVGAAIGAGEGGAAGALISKVTGRALRRETAEQLARMAGRSTGRAAAVEAGAGVALEGGSELLGSAARQATAATVTGNVDLDRRMDSVLLDAALGTVGGAATGGYAGMRAPGRAAEELSRRGLDTTGQPIPPPPPEAPPAPEREPILPPAPEPIVDPAAAHEFLRQNPGMRPPGIGMTAPLTDDEALQIANTQQQLTHREGVGILRRNAFSDMLGIKGIAQVPDEEGNRVTVRAGQAESLVPRILRAATEGKLSLDAFTPDDLANLVMEDLGPHAEPPTKTELTNIRDQLNALRDEGYLSRGMEPRSFTISTRNYEALRAARENYLEAKARTEPGPRSLRREQSPAQEEFPGLTSLTEQAPPATDQSSAGNLLNVLRAPDFDTSRDSAAAIKEAVATANPAIREDAARYQQLTQQLEDIAARERAVPRDRESPVIAQQLQDIEAEKQQVNSERAAIIDRLEGIYNGTYRAGALPAQRYVGGEPRLTAPSPAAPTTNIGRAEPDYESLPTETRAAIGEAAIQRMTAEEARRRVAEAENFQNLLDSDPIATRTFLEDLASDIPPRGGFSNQRIIAAAKARGIDLSRENATALFDWARKDDFINPLGNLIGRPQDQKSAPRLTLGPSGVEAERRAQQPTVAPTLPTPNAPSPLIGRAQKNLDRFRKLREGKGSPNVTEELSAIGGEAASIAQAIERSGPPSPEDTANEEVGATAFNEDEGRDTGEPQFSANPEASARLEPFTEQEVAEATAIFRRVAGPDAKLEYRPKLTLDTVGAVVAQAMQEQGLAAVDGVTLGDLAILSMQGSQNSSLVQTGIHEGYHVAENIGVINTNAQNILNAEAPILRQRIKAARTPSGEAILPPATVDNLPLSELRAYGANAYALYGTRFNPVVDRIFRGLTNFYNRIRNAIRGYGYATSDDVYRDFLNGRSAAETQGRLNESIRDLPPQFMASKRPTSPKEMVEQLDRQLTGPLGRYLEWFGSPTMMGKFKPALRNMSDNIRRMYYAGQEFTQGVQQYLGSVVTLSDADRGELTAALAAANTANGKYDDSRLSAQAKASAEDIRKAMRNAFDYFIDGEFTSRFTANENTKPADKRRLDALWARHAGKRLTEIPRNELRAANPEAYKDLAEFEKMYNPNYIPMLMHGSHFMAAYKRKPDGSRDTKPIGIVFFTPSNMAQRLRGQDETAYFRGQLAQKFGDPKQYIITEPREATRDAEARTFVEQMDAVEKFINMHRNATKGAEESIRNTAEKLAKEFDKRQLSRIFRKSDGVLMAVHDRNKQTYLLDTLPAYVMGASRIYARRATQADYNREANKLHYQDRAYFDKLRDYASTPTDKLYGLRSLQFFWQLGAAPDSAMVNLLQPVMQTVPRLIRDGASLGELYGAYAPTMKLLPGWFSKTKAPHEIIDRLRTTLKDPAEREAVAKAEASGVFEPIFSGEARGQITFDKARKVFGDKQGATIARGMNATLNVISTPMQVAEQLNRIVTFLGAYRAATKNPDVIRRTNNQDGTSHKTAYDYAVDVVDTTQFITSKEDKALIQRANGVTEIATQFMSFAFKTIEQSLYASKQLLSTDKNITGSMRKAAAFSLITQMGLLTAFGGLFAMPMLGLLRDAAEGLIKDEFGGPINFENELRRLLGDNGFVAKAIVRGIPYAANLADLSGRLAVSPVRSQMFTDPTIFNWLGPTGSTAGNIMNNFGSYYQNDDWVGMATLFMPRALGNVVRAGSLAAGYDMYTRRNNVIAKAEEFDAGDLLQLGLGFPPPRIADARNIVHQADQLDRAVSSQTQDLNKDAATILKNYLTYQRDGNAQRAQEALRAFEARIQKAVDHNKKVLDSSNDDSRLTRLININLNTIRRAALEEFYGIASPQIMIRNARPTSRPAVQELMKLYGIPQ